MFYVILSELFYLNSFHIVVVALCSFFVEFFIDSLRRKRAEQTFESALLFRSLLSSLRFALAPLSLARRLARFACRLGLARSLAARAYKD